MDRWLLHFLFGALLSLFLPIVPTLFSVFLCLSVSVVVWRFKTLKPWNGFFLAMAWMLYQATTYQQQIIQAQQYYSHYQKPVLVEVLIESLQVNSALPFKTNATVVAINDQRISQPFLIRLSVTDYREEENKKSLNLSMFSQGNHLLLMAKLKPVHGFANQSAFLYQTWLRSQQIVASGYVILTEPIRVVAVDNTIRQQKFNELIPLSSESLPHLSVIAALTLGEKRLLTEEQWRVFNLTATQHLIAISGLHLGLVASASYLMLSVLLRLSSVYTFLPLAWKSWLLQQNKQWLVIGLSLLLTSYYAALSGFAIPTVRAFIMLLLFWLLRLLGVNIALSRWLLLTLVAIILLMPMSLLSASFWLSCSAVSVIFLITWRFAHVFQPQSTSRFWYWIKTFLIVQVGLSLLLLPITAIIFSQLSLIGFIANVVAVPWMSFVVIPLCLLAMVLQPISITVFKWLIMLANASFEPLWQYLLWLSSWPQISVELSQIQLMILLLCFILLLGYWLFGRQSMALLCVIAICIYPTILLLSRDNFDWRITTFDVGHGLAVLIETPEQTLLYDTGAQYLSGFNLIDAVVLPYLRARGIDELDYLVLSHQDNDHAGGAVRLLSQFPVKIVMANFVLPPFKTVSGALKQVSCLQHQHFELASLKVKILWPKQKGEAENDDSCVLAISSLHHQLLLTGDISTKVEKQLLQQQLLTSSDVLIVSHHGSLTASSTAFIEQVKPKVAVFSAGFMNRWQLPKPVVIQRFHQRAIPTVNTATDGMVQIEFLQQQYQVSTFRRDIMPFWFAN
jgi:competence protein ComEC